MLAAAVERSNHLNASLSDLTQTCDVVAYLSFLHACDTNRILYARSVKNSRLVSCHMTLNPANN